MADRYRAAIECSLATARTVADAVRAREYLHLVVAPELSVLLFERVGWGPEDYTTWSKKHALSGDLKPSPILEGFKEFLTRKAPSEA